jgi:hypothetical protein
MLPTRPSPPRPQSPASRPDRRPGGERRSPPLLISVDKDRINKSSEMTRVEVGTSYRLGFIPRVSPSQCQREVGGERLRPRDPNDGCLPSQGPLHE